MQYEVSDMTQSKMNPTPKDRFQATDGAIEAHYAMLASPAFQRAEDIALLHYQRLLAVTLGKSANLQVDGMVNGWKLLGAQEFLSELRNLAEKPLKTEAPGLARALNHGA